MDVPGIQERRVFQKGTIHERLRLLGTRIHTAHPLDHQSIQHFQRPRRIFPPFGLCGLFEAYQNYNPEKGTFTTFAYYRIRGKILNRLKRKISTGEKEVHVEFDFLSYMLRTSDTNPLEKNLLLRQGIQHLKPELRKIIIYHYFEGYSFKEIAEKLQINFTQR